MRVFAVSDLHTDYRENREIVAGFPKGEYDRDALIVAGDIAHRVEIIEDTLSRLLDRFAEVFYVPGNHDLWVGEGEGDSMSKFYRILDLCGRMGVRTRPAIAGGYRILPLFSWYESGFDEDGESGPAPPANWADFRRCRWPAGAGESVCQAFIDLNEARLTAPSTEGAREVIAFSHFLPRRDLLPPARQLKFRGLLQVSGCVAIERQLRRAGARIHVFGHTHIHCDREIASVRYVQHGLGYPREWKRGPHRGFSPRQIA